jgi:hypothetical protein
MAEPVYTVIGDLIGSRAVQDRAALQTALDDALEAAGTTVRSVQRFEPTVGDEYQGACATLADALLAALLVRLTLRPLFDTRCGIGLGPVTVHDSSRTPLLQDGPGWWAARAALDAISGRNDQRRTWCVGPDDAARVNAYLICRDQVVDRLNDRGVRMLRLALLGHSQKEIAEAEGIWPSAVSQQFSRGIGVVVDSHRLFAAEEENR